MPAILSFNFRREHLILTMRHPLPDVYLGPANSTRSGIANTAQQP
jgi:hypothetical protein